MTTNFDYRELDLIYDAMADKVRRTEHFLAVHITPNKEAHPFLFESYTNELAAEVVLLEKIKGLL